ncbi:MAG: HD domain-containing protein [Candidatus Rokubacteria bacterium]|nr:HD domain-containing protein [Candidatus Rokubacteria bacterium]
MRWFRLDRLAAAHVALLGGVVAEAATDTEPVLVGGAVRDAVRRREATTGPADLDVAVRHGALALGRRLAERLGGTLVELDAEHASARVVTERARLDLTDFRATTLEGDLRARDFTVNALAVPLVPLLAHGRAPIVDPTGGLRDLALRRLRLPSPRVLDDDPLRALRGGRLEAELGLALAPRTIRAIRGVAARIADVAAERVRDELLAILRLPSSGRALRRLDALTLLAAILPEIEPMRATAQPAPHRFSVLEHSLRAVDGADRLLRRLDALSPFGEELVEHVREPVGGGFQRSHVLKLAALLHDVSKPETRRRVKGRVRFFEHDLLGAARVRAIGERLRLPERVVALLERLVRHHLRPMHLGQAGPITPRARYRFFRDLGGDARDLLLLTLVDAAAVTGASPLLVWRRARVVRELLAGWQEAETTTAAPPLVRGGDVMAHFGLSPGPEVGRLLGRAREAQDLGLVQSRDETLAWLEATERTPAGRHA